MACNYRTYISFLINNAYDVRLLGEKKMRLIDADKLLEPGYTDMFDTPIRFTMLSRYAIESAPTVKAIPIEWIKKWCNIEHKSCEERLMLRYGVITMLEDWEKENDKSNGDNTRI